jgi:hypothetical protein
MAEELHGAPSWRATARLTPEVMIGLHAARPNASNITPKAPIGFVVLDTRFFMEVTWLEKLY